ncbi:hypothetical protein SDJN02_20726, partial [Cucurbita argyrosperma subsp. argyrosperma]
MILPLKISSSSSPSNFFISRCMNHAGNDLEELLSSSGGFMKRNSGSAKSSVEPENASCFCWKLLRLSCKFKR